MNTLERVLETLVVDGTLSQGQAASVREGLVAERSRRGPRVGEAAGYLGGVLALISALLLASEFWADLRDGAQVGVLVLAGLALWVGGRWAGAELDSSGGRLAGLLWLLSVPAMAAAAGVAVDARPEASEAQVGLAVGAAAVVWGLPLWRARCGALQQLPTFAGLLVVLLAGLDLLTGSAMEDWAGLLVWAAGCVWAVLAWGGWVRPRRAGLVLGGLAALVGAQWLSFGREGPGLTLAALTVASLLIAAVPLAQSVLIGLATVGAAVFLPQILDAVFPEALSGPALTFATGVVLLAGGLSTMKTARKAIPDGR